ncbi:MAG: PL29 family lyase N-terminal domain-containing protein, partial [Bacteroidales bacterium]|nr:PL29 family lyase N-terminal domain-containing protein [Bacteroidales bacterium]
MKKILSIMLIAVVALSSCIKDDLAEIRERLTNLEEWQTSVNSSISALQSIVSALERKDYVTSVVPLSDGSGYVINFQNSGAVTIKHGNKGEAGETPIIGTRQDSDGKYYWTLNGEWLLSDGVKIPTTGTDGL